MALWSAGPSCNGLEDSVLNKLNHGLKTLP